MTTQSWSADRTLGYSWNEPLVSVVIPAFNAEVFIERTLRSVLAQTYRNLEVLVVDDGSRDGTAMIVGRLSQEDRRVALLQQENRGVAAARNLGLQHARGSFVAPLDADDTWSPEYLEKQVRSLQNAPASVAVTYAWSLNIDEQDAADGGFHAARVEGSVFTTLLCHNFLGNASCTLVRRECFEKLGVYDVRYRASGAQGCEDWDLYLRAAEQYEFRVTPEFLVGYRKPDKSMSQDHSGMARSHSLMLEGVKGRSSGLPELLFRMSRCNFYIHFAWEDIQRQNRAMALFWLREAIRAHWLTVFRPDVPLLALRSVLDPMIGGKRGKISDGSKRSRRLFVSSKVLATTGFHKVMTFVFDRRRERRPLAKGG